VYIKFDDSSFSPFGYITGAPENVTVSRYLTTPFQGWFVIRELGLATNNLTAEVEVAKSSQYEDMKGDTKCGNWCGLR